MKRTTFALVFVAAASAACGGKTKPAGTTGNTGGDPTATSKVPAPWAEVLVEGKTFTLDNRAPDAPPTDPVMVITATVHDVKVEGDVTRALIDWKDSEGNVVAGPPSQVKVGPAGVWFASDGDFSAEPNYPAGAETTEREGYANTVTVRPGGETCYEEGPGKDAGDCEDVCFASICVTPGAGITEGAGLWWPNYEMFQPVK